MTIFMALLPLLIYLGLFILVIYAIISTLILMRRRNDYLKEIRDELKKYNNRDN